jgi:hypothetical protein
MVLFVSSVGLVIAAFSLWLTIRIINLRQTWAIRTLVVILVLTVAYPLSYGPVYWLSVRMRLPLWCIDETHRIYSPVMAVLSHSPKPVRHIYWDYYFRWFTEARR